MARRPRVGLVMGDPSGIGPEVLAKTLALPATLAACRALVIADARIIARGAEAAGVTLPPRMELIDLKNCPPDEAPLGRATARTGKAAGEALEFAARMAQNGDLEAIVYAPLHKRALHEAGYGFDDELHLLAHWLECEEFGEINVLDSGPHESRRTSAWPGSRRSCRWSACSPRSGSFTGSAGGRAP